MYSQYVNFKDRIISSGFTKPTSTISLLHKVLKKWMTISIVPKNGGYDNGNRYETAPATNVEVCNCMHFRERFDHQNISKPNLTILNLLRVSWSYMFFSRERISFTSSTEQHGIVMSVSRMAGPLRGYAHTWRAGPAIPPWIWPWPPRSQFLSVFPWAYPHPTHVPQHNAGSH